MCYKLAKTRYRQACRKAFNQRVKTSFNKLNYLYSIRDSKKFWNAVRRSKQTSNDQSSDISLSTLLKYYGTKFSLPTKTSDVMKHAHTFVTNRRDELFGTQHEVEFTERMTCRYIKKLKLDCAPSGDGITAEHLLYGMNSTITSSIAQMLTLCIKFSVVPDSFANGLLTPIPKKPGCDASNPKNWRPIVVSSTLSKILEMYVLDMSSQHEFSDLQFGFIPGRGTELATVLIDDVITYCNTRGSAVYTCSLDAEGAFDAIPHCILFEKAASALPDHCWSVMYNWYSRLSVQIKWNNKLSTKIRVSVGTRQGGLSSPFLFNLFYEGLIRLLSDCGGGIRINNDSYNVFCYADDLILTSLSAIGLQELIGKAREYITSHGLNFNPSKTICTTFGSSPFIVNPTWNLDGKPLREEKTVTYLGTSLSENTNDHVNVRVQSGRRAFYGLQSAGLCTNGVTPDAAAHMIKVAIQPVLVYGCATINITPGAMKTLEKTQGRLVKSALGLPKYCRNTPLLKALGIRTIRQVVNNNQLSIMRNALWNTSRARNFYMCMLKKYERGVITYKHNSLISRCKHICDSEHISLTRYIFDGTYANQCKKKINTISTDGLSDSIKGLLCNYTSQSKHLINLLLKPF